ncbi:MAG: hypothetical protein NTW21_38260 [Verrucomicrobia bacterium]|nr:hypothetical protein [Verrucomicrobiota bacterium]
MKLLIIGLAFCGLLVGGVSVLAAEGNAPVKQAGKSPVKVFILAGQSNMEGYGAIGAPDMKGIYPYCLLGEAINPETRPMFAAIIDRMLPEADGVTIPMDGHLIHWMNKDPAPNQYKTLRLEVRVKGETRLFTQRDAGEAIRITGSPKEVEVLSAQFGILDDPAKVMDVRPAIEAHVNCARQPQPVWKTFDDVWVYFHTPRGSLTVGQGAGQGCFGPELGFGVVTGGALEQQVLIIKTAWGGMSLNGPFRPPGTNNGTGGQAYQDMVREIRQCLDNLSKDFPSYDGKGYELGGFVWWHGWNDGCEGEAAVKAYEANLTYLIKDLRKNLAAPKLPVVITGFTGPTVEGGGVWSEIRQAQANVADPAKHPEFKGTVVFVPTHSFVRPPDKSPGGWPCHEYNNPETYYLVGKASGEAMVKLLNAESSGSAP